MKSDLLKGTFIYTATNLLIKMGALILLPIMTRILTQEEYGIIGLLAPITSIITTLIGLGIYNAVLKKYVELKDNKEKLKIYKFSIICFIFIFNICLILLFKLFTKKFIESLLGIDYILILVSLLISMVNSFNNIALSIFRIEKKYYKVAGASLLSFITNYVLAIYFIKQLRLGALGNQLANLIAVIVLLVYLYIDYFKEISFKVEKVYISSTIMLGIPLIFVELTDQLVNFSDRFILRMFNINFSIIALYTLAYTGCRVFNIVTNSFVNAWIPELYENMGDYSINKKFENYISILSLLCILASLFSAEAITLLFPRQYEKAIIYMPFILSTCILQAMYGLDFYFHYYEKSKYIVFFTLLALFTNVILNIVFIPIFINQAVIVAIITTIVSMLLRTLLEISLIYRKFKIKFNYVKLIISFFVIFNPILIYISTSDISIYSFVIKCIYVFIAFFIVIDKEIIRGFLNGK